MFRARRRARNIQWGPLYKIAGALSNSFFACTMFLRLQVISARSFITRVPVHWRDSVRVTC